MEIPSVSTIYLAPRLTSLKKTCRNMALPVFIVSLPLLKDKPWEAELFVYERVKMAGKRHLVTPDLNSVGSMEERCSDPRAGVWPHLVRSNLSARVGAI